MTKSGLNWLAALSLVTVLLVSGCASSSPGERDSNVPPNQQNWSSEQASALADGKVTNAEYHDGFRRYANCLSIAGYELASIVDRDVRIDYSVPAVAVDSGADGTCYAREFDAVDSAWQLSNDDPKLTDIYRACLVTRNLSVPTSQSEMIASLLAAGIDPISCTGG